jgi:DNA topoisomerase-3
VLLLWLDCDLEGENIAYEVIDIASTYNKHLDIYRAKFSALIPRDIFRTLQQPERPNKHMSDAVDARQEIDLRLGAAFTRFQTMRLQGKFDALKDNVISYGPCQFPTLGFVVERHLKIQNFVPEDFWTISCDLETPDMDERGGVLRTSFHWDRSRLYDRLACLILFEMCVDIGTGEYFVYSCQLAVVIESQARPTSRSRPCPLNTIELQKRASRFLRMSSDTTMKVAESLYQRGILSYPRYIK